MLVFEKGKKASGRKAEEKTDAAEELEIPGSVRYGKYRFAASVFPYKSEIIPENRYTKWFDYDTIKSSRFDSGPEEAVIFSPSRLQAAGRL